MDNQLPAACRVLFCIGLISNYKYFKEKTNKLETVKGGLMEKKRRINRTWFSEHSQEVFEVIGNIVTVAILIAIGYLILHYIIRYG